MSHLKRLRLVLAVSMVFAVSVAVFAQRTGDIQAEKADSKLTVPWDEFKRILKIDEQDVILSMDTYQKLIAQTGVKVTPIQYGGNVILKQEQFKAIIDKMVAPTDVSVPFNYLVTKAVYQGTVHKENVSLQCVFTVQVLKDKGEYVKIPLISSAVALEDFKVDGAPGLVVTEGGYHNLAISGKGRYTVTASFSIKSSLGRGQHEFNIPVQQTPITLLTLTVPLENIDVKIPQAQKLVVAKQGGNSVITAAILPVNNISVQWTRELPAAEKLPAKLYTEVAHVVSIDDDSLRVTSDINCNILHSEINELRVVIPKDINILGVAGVHVGEWREIEQKGERILVIPLVIGKKGNYSVKLQTEKIFSDKDTVTSFSGFRVLDTVRDIGYAGIVLNTSAEVTIAEITGLERVAVEKLPRSIYDNSDKPLLYGFKYLKHPYSIDIDVKKHEKIAVPVAVIDSANMVTLVTFDGKIVHRLIYHVRNSGKQFMELSIPEDAAVWSVFVDNAPVESSMGKENKLLIPLKRSRTRDNTLDTFAVEVIYAQTQNRMGLAGISSLKLPSSDLLMSQLMWSLYLPKNYQYVYFGTKLEKEELASGVNIIGGEGRVLRSDAWSGMADSLKSSEMRVEPSMVKEMEKVYNKRAPRSKFVEYDSTQDEESMVRQMKAEVGFSQQMRDVSSRVSSIAMSTGVLPLSIKVPAQGQVYRFAKTIIDPTDELKVSAYFVSTKLIKTFKWLVFLGVIAYLLKKRDDIKSFLKKYYPAAKEKAEKMYAWFVSLIPEQKEQPVSEPKPQNNEGSAEITRSSNVQMPGLWFNITYAVLFGILLFIIAFIRYGYPLASLVIILMLMISIVQVVVHFVKKQRGLMLSGLAVTLFSMLLFQLTMMRNIQIALMVFVILLLVIATQIVLLVVYKKRSGR